MKAIALALATAVTALPLMAGTASAYDRVDQRQYYQSKRIEAARRSGELTWYETMKLRSEQRRIAAAERHFRADGRLTAHERARLEAMQDRASAHIRAEAHDGQKAHWKKWWQR